jgi:ParB/RepB/Spo0J family partition protein
MIDTWPTLDPSLIRVNRPNRQRSDVTDTGDLEESIARIGVLQPIIVRQSEPGLEPGSEPIFELVAGERRLKACRNLGLDVPFRLHENLTPVEAEIIELEENAKRRDLPWQDSVRAIARIHNLLVSEKGNGWTMPSTARSIGFDHSYIWRCVQLMKHWHDTRITTAATFMQACSILVRHNERKAAEAVGEIISDANQIFGPDDPAGTPDEPEPFFWSKPEQPFGPQSDLNPPSGPELDLFDLFEPPPSGLSPTPPKFEPRPAPILCTDFIQWAESYTGPKFNLLHIDFPYGVRLNDVHGLAEIEVYENNPKIFWDLTEALCQNLDRFTSYSANLIFWFSMNYYTETVRRLRETGLYVHNHPLIWFHSDNKGMAPNKGTFPRRVYDTALLCTRGERALLKQISNGYAAPTVSKPIHPTQKNVAMLRHFFSGLVDETTSLLDPACGSGCALIAAEDLGAKSVLGLELDPEYARGAQSNIINARVLRQITLRDSA